MVVGIIGKNGMIYVYEESFWSGRKVLRIDGAEASQTDNKKRVFISPDNDELTVRGNIVRGYDLVHSNGTKEVLYRNKWYEWLLLCLPFVISVFALLYLPTLTVSMKATGVILGVLIPVLVGVLGAFFTLMILRNDITLPKKIFLCVCILLLTFLLWFGIYSMMFGGAEHVFEKLIWQFDDIRRKSGK